MESIAATEAAGQPFAEQEHVAVPVGGADRAGPPQQEAAGAKLSFLQRAGRRLRRSLYGGKAEIVYRDSTFLPAGEPQADAVFCQPQGCTIFGRQLISEYSQQVIAQGLHSLPWHFFIILLSGFTLWAGPVARYFSAPDAADIWINGFLIAGMAVFVAEVVLNILCQPETNWFSVALELLATFAILWDITWFASALNLQPGGATTAAAQATKMLRFIRVIRAMEAIGAAIALHVKGVYLAKWKKANAGGDEEQEQDRLAPSNVGHRLREAATLQVAVVVVTTVVATALLLVHDTDKAPAALEAFVSVLQVLVQTGASSQQLQAIVDDMRAFAADHMSGELKPIALTAGTAVWTWGQLSTDHSTDMLQLSSGLGSVSLTVDASGRNQTAALYEIIIMVVTLVLLLLFVTSMYFSIHKMLVVPLERIFNTIRTNAASIIEALGDADLEPEAGAAGGSGKRSKDDDMSTIEAAVVKMSRIVTHFTSAGGVGLNSVKKFAAEADHSTKQWLATMVAGPAQEEVATAERTPTYASRLKGGSLARGLSGPVLFKHGSGPVLSKQGSGRVSFVPGLNRSFNDRSQRNSFHGKETALHRSSNSSQLSSQSSARKSMLALYLQRASPAGVGAAGTAGAAPAVPSKPLYQRSRLSGVGPGLLQPLAQTDGIAPADAIAAVTTTAALSPPAAPLASAASAPPSLTAATVAAPLLLQQQKESQAQHGLREDQRQALSAVDLDVLHGFGFDTLALGKQQLVPFVVSMFIEMELAYFTGADLELVSDHEQCGFIDVPTLWAFVEEMERCYQNVPYHNFWHCVDVTHTTFAMVQRVARKVQLTRLEMFALMVAALCHDLDHPGVNNAYLVNNKDPVAITYNDNSVLENKHVACLYALLERKPHINVFKELDQAQWKEVRKIIIAAVLHTDMVHHFPMVSKIDVFYEMHSGEISAVHKALRRGASTDELPKLFSTAEERQLLHVLLVHCADISNPVKPVTIADKWADRVLAEFFAQGDRERAAGQPVSPMCDRTTTGRALSQINFIEFVVAPIFVSVVRVFPEVWDLVGNLLTNREHWQEELVQEVQADSKKTLAEKQAELAKAEQRIAAFHEKYKDQFARRRRRLSSVLLSHMVSGFGSITLGQSISLSHASSTVSSTPNRTSGAGSALLAAATAAVGAVRRTSTAGERGGVAAAAAMAAVEVDKRRSGRSSTDSEANTSQQSSGRRLRMSLTFATNRVAPADQL